MRQDRRFQKKRWLDDDRKRMIPVIVIPAVVICLMVIIVLADHIKEAKAAAAARPSAAAETMQGQEPSDDQGLVSQENESSGGDNTDSGETPEGGETEPEAENPEETEAENTEPFATETFQKDSIPEILDLMKRYFNARVDADAETMNQLYGVGEVSVTALEEQKTRMRSNSKYINSIDNVVTYVAEGTEADSWVVYAVADIKFYSAKKAAPMIMWCYVTKDTEGNYRILGNELLSQEQQKLISEINHSEPVRRLASDVNGRLKEALNSDEELREIYGVLRDGSPVWKNGEEEEQVKILDGAEADESGAEAAGEGSGQEDAGSGEGSGQEVAGSGEGSGQEDAGSGEGSEQEAAGSGEGAADAGQSGEAGTGETAGAGQ